MRTGGAAAAAAAHSASGGGCILNVYLGLWNPGRAGAVPAEAGLWVRARGERGRLAPP